MKKAAVFCSVLMAIVLISSCGRIGNKATRTDTTTSGDDVFVSDDCFGRIMKEEMDVFVSTYEEAFLTPIYANEQEAIDLLIKDSVRMALLARDLTDAEKADIKSRNRELVTRSQKIATDGIALIINPQNMDSLISMATLQKIVTGEITSWKEMNAKAKYDKITVVFDNPKSSTVRYIRDSICLDKPMYKGLKALSNNQEVLDYVARTPDAMGVIGVNWISNPVDTTNFTFSNKIRPMWVSKEHPATVANSFPPHAGYIAQKEYPLRRDVYTVITDLRGTLLSGYVNFIAGDVGQRIIVKAGLVPATRPVRLINLQEEF